MFSNHLAVLIDAGKWNAQGTIVVEIPASNDGDVFGNAQPCFQDCVHRANRERIIKTEDTVRYRRLIE